jgi:hypothetical protein
MPIFDSQADTNGPDGAFFWHATTIGGARRMLNSKVLKPLGDGAVGPGFYVTTNKSDYQKAMALRARDADSTFPLILFYVYVPGFYSASAKLLDSWSPASADTDFVAVQFAADGGTGAMGQPEPSNKIPNISGDDRVDFQYGMFKGEFLHDPKVIAEISKPNVKVGQKWQQRNPVGIFSEIWAAAKTNIFDPKADYGPLKLEVQFMGPRKAFRRLVMEMAFKKEAILASTRIVGAQLFNSTAEPLPIKAIHDGVTIDLAGLKIDDDPQSTDNAKGGFHDAVWVDLDALLDRIKPK